MEEWKILNENKNYAISSNGNLKNIKTNTIRKLKLGTNGYLNTSITINKKVKTVYIHRLVAQYFIPNPYNKPQVNHIDCNKENNNANNLEWCSQSENNKHIYNMGRKISPAKGKYGKEHPKSKAVVQFKDDKVIIFDSITEMANANKIGQPAISNQLRRNKIRKGKPNFMYYDEYLKMEGLCK